MPDGRGIDETASVNAPSRRDIAPQKSHSNTGIFPA
jgi:hypothetical protein